MTEYKIHRKLDSKSGIYKTEVLDENKIRTFCMCGYPATFVWNEKGKDTPKCIRCMDELIRKIDD